MSPEQLKTLLTKARLSNGRLGISGMLLYEGQSFIQVLEGDSVKVKALFDKISLDPRHDHIMLLFKQDTEKRSFEGWNMGFFNADPKTVAELPGYSSFFSRDFSKSSFWRDGDRARELFLQFRDGRWRRHVAA